MNEVSPKGCPLKGTTKRGAQEVTAEHPNDKTTVQKKTNMNGIVNGLVEEKPPIVKKQNKKNKKIGKRNTDKSSTDGAVDDDKIIPTTENIKDKHIVDSSINVKNNQKSNKNSKSRKSNSGSAVKKNSVNVSNVPSEVVIESNSEPLQSSSNENGPSVVHEIIPKNSNRSNKKDKSRKTDLINKDDDKQLSLELNDFDITSIITKKMVDICRKPPQQPKLEDGEPSCSKNTDNITEVTETLEGLVLKEESIAACMTEDVKSDEKKTEDEKEKNYPPVTYVQYESELQMPMIMKIIQKDLSEPYSIYTYRYFIHNWPNLCFLAMCEEQCVGAIVCKLDIHRKEIKRGYIAMLAVDKNYRTRGIGSTLVRRAIEEMIAGDADEVVLETEITNKPALRLYEALGFVRDKRLFRYYLNGVDALRLKLWLR